MNSVCLTEVEHRSSPALWCSRLASRLKLTSTPFTLRPLHYTTGFPGSPACRQQIMGLLTLHNYMSQYLIINLSLFLSLSIYHPSSIYLPYWFCFSRQLIQKARYFEVKGMCSRCGKCKYCHSLPIPHALSSYRLAKEVEGRCKLLGKE